MGRYARLHRLWALRQFIDGRVMLMNRRYPTADYPDAQETYVLRSCDGRSDFDSPAFLPVHRGILQGFLRDGIAETCAEGEGLEQGQALRRVQSPMLTEIHWAITGYCNMKCPHCFMEAPEGRYGQVTMEQARRFIDQFDEAGAVRVSLTGGEPLMHPRFREIVDAIVDKGMMVNQIVTNAVLLDNKLIDFLRRMPWASRELLENYFEAEDLGKDLLLYLKKITSITRADNQTYYSAKPANYHLLPGISRREMVRDQSCLLILV